MFFFNYSYLSSELTLFFTAFLYLSLSSFILSFGPLLAASPVKRNSGIGEYMSRTRGKWNFAAFLIGLYQGLLSLPISSTDRTYLLILLLFIILILVFLVVMGTYRSGVEQVKEKEIKIYSKFKKRNYVSREQTIDFMSDSIDEFNSSGNKERLVISFSVFLSRYGKNEEEIESYLRRIIEYKPHNARGYSGINRKNIMKREISRRIDLVNAMVSAIERDVGGKNEQ